MTGRELGLGDPSESNRSLASGMIPGTAELEPGTARRQCTCTYVTRVHILSDSTPGHSSVSPHWIRSPQAESAPAAGRPTSGANSARTYARDRVRAPQCMYTVLLRTCALRMRAPFTCTLGD